VPISLFTRSPSERPSRRLGDEQHDEILHRAGKHHAGQNPEHAGQIAHLRGQHGAHERACPGNGREVVPEQHVLVGGNVVEPVVVTPGGRLAGAVQAEHLVGNEAAVVAIRDQVDAYGGHHHP
jgi:hypothetical protein